MKNVILSVLSIFLFVSDLSCSSAKVRNHHFQREWMLVSLDGFTKDQLIAYKAGINLTDKKMNNKIKGNASMGCNRIFFISAFKNNGKLKISGLRSTEMACQNMSLEEAFINRFSHMSHYEIKGHHLILSDATGDVMKFTAADWD